jgi:hypothetical protein
MTRQNTSTSNALADGDIQDIHLHRPPLLTWRGSCICLPLSLLPGAACFVVNPREEVAITHFGLLTRVEKTPGCKVESSFSFDNFGTITQLLYCIDTLLTLHSSLSFCII